MPNAQPLARLRCLERDNRWDGFGWKAKLLTVSNSLAAWMLLSLWLQISGFVVVRAVVASKQAGRNRLNPRLDVGVALKNKLEMRSALSEIVFTESMVRIAGDRLKEIASFGARQEEIFDPSKLLLLVLGRYTSIMGTTVNDTYSKFI